MAKESIEGGTASISNVFPDRISKRAKIRSSALGLTDAQSFDVLAALPDDMFSYVEEKNGVVVLGPVILSESVELKQGAHLRGSATCDAYIDYTEHGRNDRSPNFHSSTNDLNNWELPFPDTTLGGRVHLTLQIPWSSGGFTGVDTHRMDGTICGFNPLVSVVKSLLPDIVTQVIAYKESRFRQFGPDFKPTFGPPQGFGVMQIDNHPVATARQIWNWRENVAGGLTLYSTKKGEVKRHFKNIRDQGHGIPDLSEAQYKLALYQYYNGGFYWTWNATSKRWVKDGATGYADDFANIEAQVVSGHPPPDWSPTNDIAV